MNPPGDESIEKETQREGSFTQAIYLVGRVQESHHPALLLALRLMTASESMRSASRGLSRLPNSLTPAVEADRYYLLFALIGAVGEAIRVIKYAVSHEHIQRDWIAGKFDNAKTWDHVTTEPAAQDVKVAMRVRDKYWAHWDPDVAAQFISSLEGEANDHPVAESSGAGENENTSFRWVRLSWFADIEREFALKTGDQAVQMIQNMADLARGVGDLASVLALELIRHSGLDLKHISAVKPGELGHSMRVLD